MNAHVPSKLDTEKFRKVHALMTGGATDGERKAARARAEAMAAKAGMTLAQAVSNLDGRPAVGEPVNIFAGFDNWMEEREPGWKAEKARQNADRKRRDAARHVQIMQRYGSEAALFSRSSQELALVAAIAPFVTEWQSWTDTDGTRHRFPEKIAGKRASSVFWKADDLPPEAQKAIATAFPWPSSLAGALDEVRAWDRLRLDRGIVSDGEWSHYAEVECRVHLLEQALESKQPAASWQDVKARLDWKRYEWERQWTDPTEREDPFMERLEADIADLLKRQEASPQPQGATPRTNAEKRKAVLSILDTHPELSDREVARRAGVSPQTVNTWRKRQRP